MIARRLREERSIVDIEERLTIQFSRATKPYSTKLTMHFTATLQLDGKTATGICVPEEIVAALGGGSRPPVRVTLAGHSYQTTVARMRGEFKIAVSAAVRDQAGIA